ncbi:MAG: hypothetical protein KF746_27180 [Chitinophagaceae bacterium]|nr:hypothetical protein [Chitinophagaceae bacterium]
MISNKFILIIVFCSLALVTRAQKIEYYFGSKSGVTDSINYVIDWFKKNYKKQSLKELDLFAGIDYCDGGINLFFSRYSNRASYIVDLVKKTNRFIAIDSVSSIPVIFQTDVLAKQVGGELEFINMNGYYLRIEKDGHYIWKVTRMNVTF